MATWAEFDAELALWRESGAAPTFWWRDDDTEAPTDDLDRLIAMAEQYGAPLHLAVVPHAIDAGLAARLKASPRVYALQHGFAHKNHEVKPLRASEVGISRDVAQIGPEMQEGWRRMQAAGLPNMLPVFVPPWNRIGDQVVPHLPAWGYTALSNFDIRPTPSPVKGLQHFNGHMDPIKWKGGARFTGTEKALNDVVEHLQHRRTGIAERDEPTGFVTHHLQTDEATWAFMDAFMARATHKGASRWITLKEVLHG
jgi:hypothetical protein